MFSKASHSKQRLLLLNHSLLYIQYFSNRENILYEIGRERERDKVRAPSPLPDRIKSEIRRSYATSSELNTAVLPWFCSKVRHPTSVRTGETIPSRISLFLHLPLRIHTPIVVSASIRPSLFYHSRSLARSFALPLPRPLPTRGELHKTPKVPGPPLVLAARPFLLYFFPARPAPSIHPNLPSLHIPCHQSTKPPRKYAFPYIPGAG